MAFAILSKPRKFFELAGSDQGLQLLTAQVVSQYLPSVEPVFDMAIVNDDPNLIPFSYRLQNFVDRGNQGVKSAGGSLRILAVTVFGVVKHLHLGSRLVRLVEVFRNQIDDAAVAAGSDLPLQL